MWSAKNGRVTSPEQWVKSKNKQHQTVVASKAFGCKVV